MKKLTIIICFAIFSSNLLLNAQSLEQILDSYYQINGYKYINNVKTLIIHKKDSINFSGFPEPNVGTSSIYAKRPFLYNSSRKQLYQTFTTIYNGKTLLEENALGRTIKSDSIDKTSYSIDKILMRVPAEKSQLSFIKVETLKQVSYYVIQHKQPNKGTEYTIYYINTETYLLDMSMDKIRNKTVMKEINPEIWHYYSNYQKLNNIQVPFMTKLVMKGKNSDRTTTVISKIQKLEINPEISDEVFLMD